MTFKRITGDMLKIGLDKKLIAEVMNFVNERKLDKSLQVIGDIDYNLRRDYLDESLSFPDRAIKNIEVSSDLWRGLMMDECNKAVDYLFDIFKEDITVVYPWRGALVFAPSFAYMRGVRNLHIGIARNEKNPDETGEMWMTFDSEDLSLIGREEKIIIADPMLATGGSIKSIIELIMSLNENITKDQFVILSIVSAPEGIYNTFNLFPGINILTVALDDCLNEVGYIVPGLGDAGDKFFDGLTTDFFEEIKFMFSPEQWRILDARIAMANVA